ncbi:MAG: TIGR03792 family protein [Synechococcales bacterium]|nr:TIGR03792 family protein [Synechococcales bacterium]
MVIEWLVIEVPIAQQVRFLQVDEAIWTRFLRTCSGFVRKEVWIDPTQPTQVIFVIHWHSRLLWKAIAPEQLGAIDRQFVATMGQVYPIIAAREFEIQEPLAETDYGN